MGPEIGGGGAGRERIERPVVFISGGERKFFRLESGKLEKWSGEETISFFFRLFLFDDRKRRLLSFPSFLLLVVKARRRPRQVPTELSRLVVITSRSRAPSWQRDESVNRKTICGHMTNARFPCGESQEKNGS